MTEPSERLRATRQWRSGRAREPVDGAAAAAPSRWLIFAVVSIALFMSSLDSTIVATALPTLRHALHTRINWASWTMTAYQLGLVVAMPVGGRIADQFGAKRVFVVSAVVFTSASLLCGLASSIAMLIALRVLQALGGGAFMPAASGIIVRTFGSDRDRALGMFSSIFPAGALVGPIFGGIIIADWSWRGIFLVNVPVGLLFTVLAIRHLPASPPRGERTDFAGALLLGATILGAMLAITRLGDVGASPLSLGFALPATSCVAAAWLLRVHSGRVEHPLIPLRLLANPTFAVMNAINFVWGACAIGFGSLVPLFAEERYRLSPLSSGSLLTARAVGEIVLAISASLFIRRTGYRLPMIGGFLLIAAGLAWIAVAPPALGPYSWLAIGAALTGVGTGASAPAANNATIELSPDDVGAIAGLRGAARQSGAILGVALTTSVVARSSHEALALGHAFYVFAGLLTCMVPLVFLVPDARRARAGTLIV